MPRRCGKGAALMFTAMVLAGCALVDSVIEIEQVKAPPRKAGPVALAASSSKCGPGGLDTPGCSRAQVLSKASSARYDNGPVLKPIKKGQEEQKTAGPSQDSILVKAVKNWFRTGMQLHSWVKRQ